MNKGIIDFMENQTCTSICCIDQHGKPYCFSCYYAINADDVYLYFKSSADTYHGISIQNNAFVSGTILPDKLNKLITKGIQFTGTVISADESTAITASSSYHKKYPVGLLIPGQVYIVRIETIKMTDSSLGFGKKLAWKRAEEISLQ